MSATIKYKGNTIATASNNTKTLLTAGKYMEANVVVTDNGGGGGANLYTESVSYTPTESAISATLTPTAGYDGFDQVNIAVGAISSSYIGSGIPQMSSANLSASGATVTAPSGYYASNATKTISNASTPYIEDAYIEVDGDLVVEAKFDNGGYVSSGTKTMTSPSHFNVKSAATYYPSASDQTVAADQYLFGAQTIKGVTYTNLTAGNIKKDVVVKIGDSADDDRIVSVTGTYEGGGGGYTNDDFADLSKPIGEVTTTLASLPPYFFYQRTGVTKFTGNNVTTLSSASYAYCHTFYGCTALQEVVLPNVTGLTDKNSVFRDCTSLRKVTLSNVKTLNGTSVFNGCSSLEGIVFPSAYSASGNAGTTLGNSMFSGCTALAYFDSASVYNIQSSTFKNCSSLSVVVIRNTANTSGICALANVTGFDGTPFASSGTGGTLYVPSAKIATYQAATNWSTLLGYANNQIKAIEGSYYETHWADGTAI